MPSAKSPNTESGDAKGSSTSVPQTDDELFDAAFEAMRSFNPFFGPAPLADAATEPGSLKRIGGAMLTKPSVLIRRSIHLAVDSTKIALGRSEIDLNADRRFQHGWFESNPLFRRLGQQYLAWRESVHGYIDDLELDPGANKHGHFLADLITESAAPTNALLGNPAALEEAVNTRGKSLQRGFRNWLGDQAGGGGMPSMVDTEPFVIGETIATTEGEVVFANEVLELIRYKPTTAKVRQRPLFVVPPQINKYYVLDLAPGRSMVEAALADGQQVFMVSWRNATPDQRHWDLDFYVFSVLEAVNAALALTRQPSLNMLGVCAGGMTSAATLGYLAATDDDRVNAATFLVTGLDWGVPTLLATMVGGANAGPATQRSQAAGVLSGRDLGRLFAWLRPNDLVWNYWVNNYLMGRKPPAFDVLAWNVDATNLPAGLHADFMAIAAQNTLTEPGTVEVLGEKIDLQQVTCDTYVVAGQTDHITPWESCYSTVNMVGGQSEFVLCASGHVQTLVCPTDNPKAKYFAVKGKSATKRRPDPDSWMADAAEHNGSWWTHWFKWLNERSEGLVNAPKRLDSNDFPSLGPAPGTYVHAEA